MKKDVGMTTAQKSKETRRMESLFCISSQQSLHIRTLLHYNLKLPDVYVGIVGWIYRTKIPSFLFPYFFEQWSSLHLFSFHEMLFPLCSSYVDILCKVLAITAGCGYKGYHLVHKVGLKGSGSERPGGCGWRL